MAFNSISFQTFGLKLKLINCIINLHYTTKLKTHLQVHTYIKKIISSTQGGWISTIIPGTKILWNNQECFEAVLKKESDSVAELRTLKRWCRWFTCGADGLHVVQMVQRW